MLQRFGRACGLALLILALLGPAAARAAEIRPGDSVVVGPGETIDDDLYAFGQQVTILGRINGNVFAAGNTVALGGTVTGDLFAAGNTVTVTGDVRGSVRAAGNTIGLTAPVGRDVVAAAGSLAVSHVGRDVLAAGGTIGLSGPVGRNVRVAGGDLTIAAPVGGAADVDVQRLTLTDGATIAGTLRQAARTQATIAQGAWVDGGVVRVEPPAAEVSTPQQPNLLSGVVGFLRGMTGVAALGLLLVLAFPAFAGRAAGAVLGSPWASLGLGIGEVLVGPVLAIAVLALGIVLGGWWLAFAVLAVYGGLLSVGYAVGAFVAGGWLMARAGRSGLHPAWALLLGVVALAVVGSIPVVGGLVVTVAALFGVGGLSLALARAYRGSPPSATALRAAPTHVDGSSGSKPLADEPADLLDPAA